MPCNTQAFCIKISVLFLVTQSCPTFATPRTVARQAPLSMGIFQARKLECVAMLSSRRYSQPRDWTQVFHTAGGFFTIWANREAYKHQYTNSNPRVLSPDWILIPFSTLNCSFIFNMPLDYWELDDQKRGKKQWNDLIPWLIHKTNFGL